MENHKLAIIYGVADIAKNIGDGQIERLGDSKLEHEYHSANLLAEAKKRYPEASIFQKLTYRHRPEVISYFFTLFGHIVFLNTTKNEKIYGKSGLFIMPKTVTDAQIASLDDFCAEIENFEVDILYDCEIIDGVLDGKEMLAIKKGNLRELFRRYFERTRKHNKVK